jgi:hypothetical protein
MFGFYKRFDIGISTIFVLDVKPAIIQSDVLGILFNVNQ